MRRNRIVSSSQNSNLPISYEIIGDIGIIRMFSNNLSAPKELRPLSISLMKSHKNIKTVLFQSGAIEGIFRLRKLIYVLGEKKTHTIHREHNCLFLVDVEKCYFSPRLSYERKRISSEIKKKEIIVNMFAGVGSFSIIIVKRIESAKVYSIDLNPIAINFMKRNIRLNRVYNQIIPLLGDAKMILDNTLQGIADRVLMPLPEKAFEYLPSALLSLKSNGGWIHYYDFEYAKKSESSIEKAKVKVSKKLTNIGVLFDIPTSRIVRSVGPNWHQIVLDIKVLSKPDRF